MASGIIAAFVAVLIWGFIEALGRFYPSRQTWRRLRTVRSRWAVRRMRERFEEAGARHVGRRLAIFLLAVTVAWVASASLLDKRWYEVVADAAPSSIVLLGLLRVPSALTTIAERMKDYEREVGEDPDKPFDHGIGDGGPEVFAL